jgi:hypothetical protein
MFYVVNFFEPDSFEISLRFTVFVIVKIHPLEIDASI